MTDYAELIPRIVAGDVEAWTAFQAAAQPTVLAMARGHRTLRSKGLAALPDDVAEVVTATFERLSRSDYQNLKSYLASAPPPESGRTSSFDAWLYGAVDYTVLEHIRKRIGRRPAVSSTEAPRVQPSKRDLQSQAARLDDVGLDRAFVKTLGMTARLTVAEIYEHVEREFGAVEARAIRLYYAEDLSFEQIAAQLSLPTAKDAQKMIRRLNGRLRHRFVDKTEPDSEDDDSKDDDSKD
jgi:DNA-directed RNA polymerase specialized sigma24 family protein